MSLQWNKQLPPPVTNTAAFGDPRVHIYQNTIRTRQTARLVRSQTHGASLTPLFFYHYQTWKCPVWLVGTMNKLLLLGEFHTMLSGHIHSPLLLQTPPSLPAIPTNFLSSVLQNQTKTNKTKLTLVCALLDVGHPLKPVVVPGDTPLKESNSFSPEAIHCP